MRFLLPFLFCLSVGAADYYVATDGSDANPGTLGSPFATLGAARDAVRGLSHPLSSGATVYLRGGRYLMQSALALSGSQDSGTPTALVSYRNYASESVLLIGGTNVNGFAAVTNAATLARLTASAQTNVLVADLTAQGITALGTMTNHGYGHSGYDTPERPFQSELLFQDRSMQLARFPNTGWLNTAAPIYTNGFAYTGANPSAWADMSDVWVQGYFPVDYSDCWERVVAINTTSKNVTNAWPGVVYDNYGNVGQRFFFFNVLEELDAAGEYYIDRTNGLVYFWPPSSITNNACVVTITTNLVTLDGVSNVVFSGLTFEGGKSQLIRISGGKSNLITGCTLRGGAADAVKILGSPQSGVTRSLITDIGERGIWFYGSGDRTNLISGSNFVSNCTFSNVSRLCRANKNAVEASHTYYFANEEVVGMYIGHNLFCYMPHQAINLYGNNNLIEYNEIHHVCTETADAGALYSGFDWTFRGTVIRNNYFHDINMGGGASDYSGVFVIYADAAWSGATIYGNIFCQVDHAIFLNSGRDNLVQNNLFVDVTNCPASKLQAFTVAVNQSALGNGFGTLGGTMWNRLTNMPFQSVTWSNQYPALATITNGPYVPWTNTCLAMGNVIGTNVFWNCYTNTVGSYSGAYWKWLHNADTNATVSGNLTNADPLFVDYANRNFALQTNSPAWALGFQPIPTSGFGPEPLPPPPPSANIGSANAGTATFH